MLSFEKRLAVPLKRDLSSNCIPITPLKFTFLAQSVPVAPTIPKSS